MDDATIEALREVLQDMTAAIELLVSGDRSGAALIRFIEEMLKTIESWAAKYNVVLDGSLASVPAQGSQPETHPPHIFPSSSLPAQEVMGAPLDATESLRDRHPIEGGCIQKCRVSPSQESASLNAGSADDATEDSQIDRTERAGWQAVGRDHSSGIISPSERRKTRSQVFSINMDMMSKDEGIAKMWSPQSEEGLNSGEASLNKEHLEGKGSRIESPSWLPEGWIVEGKAGGIGSHVNSKNKVYIDPTSNYRFQSKKEVLAFLGTIKRKRGRPRKTDASKDPLPGHGTDTVQAPVVYEPVGSSNSEAQLFSDPSLSNEMPSKITAAVSEVVDTTKRKRGRPRKADSLKALSDLPLDHINASVQACDIPESLVGANMEAQAPATTSPGDSDVPPQAAVCSIPFPMNNLPWPNQSGQPSEWLVYESLASLPLPTFEHLRFMENNANKLATNSSPPALWPWILGNSEGTKKPSTDIKSHESKPVEEGKPVEAGPTSFREEVQADESVPKRPKKAARKNAS